MVNISANGVALPFCRVEQLLYIYIRLSNIPECIYNIYINVKCWYRLLVQYPISVKCCVGPVILHFCRVICCLGSFILVWLGRWQNEDSSSFWRYWLLYCTLWIHQQSHGRQGMLYWISLFSEYSLNIERRKTRACQRWSYLLVCRLFLMICVS